jgi:hypothetical protein
MIAATTATKIATAINMLMIFSAVVTQTVTSFDEGPPRFRQTAGVAILGEPGRPVKV